MYKNKTSLQKTPLHNHMSVFFKKRIISMSSKISQHLIFGNKSKHNLLQLVAINKEKVSLAIPPTASEF